jgi:hypothetical protein
MYQIETITNVCELVKLAGLDDPSATLNKPNHYDYDKYVKVSGKEQQQEQHSNEKKSSKL